jgi:hypothetical protein
VLSESIELHLQKNDMKKSSENDTNDQPSKIWQEDTKFMVNEDVKFDKKKIWPLVPPVKVLFNNKQKARDDTKALGPCKLTSATSSKGQLQLYWGLSVSYKPMRNNASNNKKYTNETNLSIHSDMVLHK